MIAHPNIVTIDLAALVSNLRQVRGLVGRNTRIMGVVKADAYGHGLLQVGKTLERNGIDCLGVASLHEAILLREGGIRGPVVILCGIQTREDAHQVLEKGLVPVVFDLASAQVLSQECRNHGGKPKVHVKVDTGMGRLGVPDAEIVPFLEKLISFRNLEIEGLITHLATADEADTRPTEDQVGRFERAIATGRSLGLDLTLNHMANSAGIMHHPRTHFDMVRPGIMLYGGRPSPDFVTTASLAPVMQFKARVIQVRTLPDGTSVSYGRTYWTQGSRRVAVVSAGYADGLPRALSNRGKVLVGGKPAPILGRVCMNLTVCDITDNGEVRPGDEAVFLGSQGREWIFADDVARYADTISYEIFCSIGRKNIRTYLP